MSVRTIPEIIPRLTNINYVVLSAGVAQTVEIPAGTIGVTFNWDADFYCKVGNSAVVATIPTANINDGSGPYFNPMGFEFIGGDSHISLISDYDCKIMLMYF